MLASRPDIVREDYMNELCTLQDDVPSFPDTEVSCHCLLLERAGACHLPWLAATASGQGGENICHLPRLQPALTLHSQVVITKCLVAWLLACQQCSRGLPSDR